MSDYNRSTAHAEAPTGPGKNPKQVLSTMAFSLVLAIIVIFGLVYYVTSGQKPVDSMVNSEQAVAERIQKIGSVEIRAADRPLRSGEEVFKAQCTTCHNAGVLGAPKFGDASAWAARIKKGYGALLNSAVKGKNDMVPQGGGDFGELEIGRAVVYMANAAGAKFEEPKAPVAPEAATTAPATQTAK